MKKHLFLILMLCATGAHAELNKWIDAQGRVHYGDQPPPGAESSRVYSPAAAPAAKTKSYAEREAEMRKARQAQQEGAAEAEKKRTEADTRADNCTRAKQNLVSLQSGARMAEFDANGERRYLDDNEIRQRTAEAQKSVDDWCKKE